MKQLTVVLLIVFSSLFASAQDMEQYRDFLFAECDAYLYIEFGTTFEKANKIVTSKGFKLRETNLVPVDSSEDRGVIRHRLVTWDAPDKTTCLIVMFDDANSCWFTNVTIQTRTNSEAESLASMSTKILQKNYIGEKMGEMFTKVCHDRVLMAKVISLDNEVQFSLAQKRF